jgi:hypothetical protein
MQVDETSDAHSLARSRKLSMAGPAEAELQVAVLPALEGSQPWPDVLGAGSCGLGCSFFQ